MNRDVFLLIFCDEVKGGVWFTHDKVVHGLFVTKLGTPHLPISLLFNPGAVFGLSAMHISKEIPLSSSCLSVPPSTFNNWRTTKQSLVKFSVTEFTKVYHYSTFAKF